MIGRDTFFSLLAISVLSTTYPSIATAATYSLTTIHSFDGANGATPYAGLVADSSGNLYGTTRDGGANNKGTVFEIEAETGRLKMLVTFNGLNGASPVASLTVDSSGNLYGTTYLGGANNFGTVFKVEAKNRTLTTLASFQNSSLEGTDGGHPVGGILINSDGNLYGTTGDAGVSNSFGTVFKISPTTHDFSTITWFNGHNGWTPSSTLIEDKYGSMFGTTYFGDNVNLNNHAGYGTVFEIAYPAHIFSTRVIFNGANGAIPASGLMDDINSTEYINYGMFGTTTIGGANGLGTIFQYLTGFNRSYTIFSFDGTNGANPYAGLIEDTNGDLYGTTVSGGTYGYGTIFQKSTRSPAFNSLFSFDGNNGASPYGSLYADAEGNFYGTTAYGGANNLGTVFKLSIVPENSSLLLAAFGLAAFAYPCIKRFRRPTNEG